MTSKEALERIIKSHFTAMACLGTEDKETQQTIDIVKKDLERLEELEKVINNIFYAINQGLGMLPNNNFEFLKEVLENE